MSAPSLRSTSITAWHWANSAARKDRTKVCEFACWARCCFCCASSKAELCEIEAQASATTDDAREQVRARELQVRADVSQAFYGLQTAFQTVSIQQNNRTAGQEQ